MNEWYFFFVMKFFFIFWYTFCDEVFLSIVNVVVQIMKVRACDLVAATSGGAEDLVCDFSLSLMDFLFMHKKITHTMNNQCCMRYLVEG